MKRSFVFIVALLGIALLAGCANVIPALKASRDAAVQAKAEGMKAVEGLEGQAQALPPGDPVRVALEAKVAKAKEVLANADKYIATANAAIDSAEQGQITPELRDAANVIPYGAYVVGAIGLVLGLVKQAQNSKLSDALRRVVQSWEDVGADLAPDEKKRVADIQGPVVTAQVSAIKASLASR